MGVITYAERIGTRPCPDCPVCGGPGDELYAALRERHRVTPDTWSTRRCLAGDCGALWLDPMPTEGELYKAYEIEDYYTRQELELPPRVRRLKDTIDEAIDLHVRDVLGYTVDRQPSTRRRLALRAALRLVPGARDHAEDTACHLPSRPTGATFLEIGFGNGDQLRRMDALGWQVTGVDMDEVVVDRLRGAGFDVRHGDLYSQRFPERSFDGIYNSHLFEHVYDPVGFLSECHRLLAPGGSLVIVTPNAASTGHRHFGASWFPLMPPQHLTMFTPAGIETAARKAGFEEISVRTSARRALNVYLTSPFVRDGGTLTAQSDGAVPARMLAPAIAGSVTQAALVAARRPVGEEIVMSATRTR